MITGYILAVVVLTAVTVLVWRGDRRTDLCRCPRCWYDMSGIGALTCPECGHVSRSTAQLYLPRRTGRAWRLGVGVAWLVLIGSVYFSLPGPWTQKVPRPLLSLALAIAAPRPVPASTGTAMDLPVPNAAFKGSQSAWERLVWDYQVLIALEDWADAVLANRGPITSEELSRLAPLAEQAHALYRQFGGLTANDSRISKREKNRIAQALSGAANDPMLALRYTWVLSEMQFDGGDYSHRSDFAFEPDAIILQALTHSDPKVRVFGIHRFGRRVHRVVMAPASPMPPGRDLIEEIARSDPDPAAREQARIILNYCDVFLRKR